MNENVFTALVASIAGILGAAGTIYAARGQIKQHQEEQEAAAGKTILANALQLHEVYRAENELLRERVASLTKELEDLRHAFNTIGWENAQLKQRIKRLEERLDTGDLDKKKPAADDSSHEDW